MPGGIEIMIAMEKPKAMTTSSVRAFLLETFLIALVKVPKIIPLVAVFQEKSIIKPFFRIRPKSNSRTLFISFSKRKKGRGVG
jgi:hypothetical protein